MKILMTLESSFPPDKRVENEVDALLDKGFEVHIICTGSKGELETDVYKTARVHRIFPGRLIRKSSVAVLKIPLYFIYWKTKLKKLLDNQSYDVIHIHDLPLIKPVNDLKKQFNFKIVLDLHENWPGLLSVSPHTQGALGKLLCSIRQWEQYEKIYLKKADRIIVVIEEAKERILSLNIGLQEINVISNTVNLKDNLPQKSKSESDSGKIIFIYEGGITYHRGLQNILKAFSRIDNAGDKAELWIIGDGSYLKHLKKMCNSLNLNNYVKFYGWQPENKVFELLAQANIALIPHIKSSHTDNTIPHKLFHYLYTGLPILASNCNPVERIIRETSGGFIYQHDNIEELVGKIEMILRGTEYLKTTNGRNWIIQRYNWSNEEKKLIKMYRGL